MYYLAHTNIQQSYPSLDSGLKQVMLNYFLPGPNGRIQCQSFSAERSDQTGWLQLEEKDKKLDSIFRRVSTLDFRRRNSVSELTKNCRRDFVLMTSR